MPPIASTDSQRAGARRRQALAACLTPGLFLLAACGGASDGGTTTPPEPGVWLGFQEAVAYPSGGSGVTSLVARDVTGDNLLDLVAVTRGQAVRVLPGSAGGTFGAAVAYLAGNDPLRAVVGDVDGDGRQDLVVIGHFDNAFHVRRGLGAGQFGDAVRYPLRNHGRQLALADLNGDHVDDVVAVHDGSGQPIWVSVFLGATTGALQPVWETGTPYVASKEIAVGDFDGDGRADVAVGAGDDRTGALFFRGRGTGELEAPLALPPAPTTPGATDGTEGVAAADLNGDGSSDLVIAHLDPGGVSVRMGGGAGGGVGAPRLVAAPPSIDVALGDVDGDGKLDAVVSHHEAGVVSVFPGVGDGTFGAARTFAAGPAPAQLTLADFDRDGRLDVAVASATDHQVRVLRNRGGGGSR